MLYFDTSFLVPLFIHEATTRQIETFMAKPPTGVLAISHMTRVEFSSLLARDVRMGMLDISGAHDAAAAFEALMLGSFEILLPLAEDYDLAKDYLARYETGLRAPDALHLAVAGNRRAEAIYSLDKTLLKAGKSLGLPVGTGMKLPGYGR